MATNLIFIGHKVNNNNTSYSNTTHVVYMMHHRATCSVLHQEKPVYMHYVTNAHTHLNIQTEFTVPINNI